MDLEKVGVKSSIIDKEPIRRVISSLLEADDAVEPTSSDTVSSHATIRVIDAFLVPKFHFDPIKKQFYQYVRFFFIFFSFLNIYRVLV